MPKTVFANGTAVEAAWFNAMTQGPIFDDQDLDGHAPKITNADLDTSAGQILPEWEAFRDALKPTAGSGLSLNYTGGSTILPNGNLQAIAAGSVLVPNNTTSRVYINELGAVEASASPPVIRMDLASVVASGGNISSVSDLRPRFRVLPRPDAIKVLGGTGGGGDVTYSVNTTLSDGIYYFRNLTVNNGVTLTIEGYAEIYCSGSVIINGIVNVSTLLLGGPTSGGTAISATGGGEAGRGTGAGVTNQGGAAYNVGASPIGSSGAAGFFRTSAGWSGATFASGAGGNGGGCLRIEAGGSITVAGSIVADGGNAGNGSLGGGTGDAAASGGGGGAGGTIILFSATSVVVSGGGTLAARGGNGGTTSVSGAISGVRGGAAGGGGQIVLIAPTVVTVGATVTVAAGSPGTPTTGSSTYTGSGGGGGNGGAGGSGHGTNIAAAVGRLISRTYIPVG